MSEIAIGSPAVVAGVGLFETMLAIGERLLHLDEHAGRMSASCAALRFPPVPRERFTAAARAAAEGNDGEAAVRVVWVDAGGAWRLDAQRFAVPPATIARRAQGRAVTLPPDVVRSLPEHKLTSYAVCSLSLRDAVARGADEALFTTRDGAILEGTASNVFAVRGSTLITSGGGILPGIVRGWVLRAARELGMEVELRPPAVDEIEQGAFFTGSLTTLAPIRVIDGRACAAPGEAFEALRSRYRMRECSASR